jgi:hypothetical protein
MFGIEPGKMHMFQDHEFCNYFIAFHICNLNLVNKRAFQILQFHNTTVFNNKWKPQYYCLLYMIYNTLM